MEPRIKKGSVTSIEIARPKVMREGFRRREHRRTVTYAFRFFEANFCVCDDDLDRGQGLLLHVTGRF